MRLLIAFIAAAAFAQEWEIGAVAGGAASRSAALSAPAGSAAAGFAPGFGFGAALAHDMYPRLGGEIRYEWLRRSPRLSAAGERASFSGQAHALHYDVLGYLSAKRSRGRACFSCTVNNSQAQPGPSPDFFLAARPYVIAGGGFKLFRGTGAETAYRPLMEYGWLTRASEWKPLLVAGVGVKVALGSRFTLRLEVTDQISPVPQAVIAPARGARISGWLHDFIPAVILSWRKP